MRPGSSLLVLLLFILGSLSGCVFLRHTTFTLESLTVDDDHGFSRVTVRFNVSDTATLTLVDPQGKSLFSDEYFAGPHYENIFLGTYRKTPPAGTYKLQAYDTSKTMIFQNDLLFKGQNLSVSQIQDDRWHNTSSTLLIAVHLTMHNSGDLPSYPSQVEIQFSGVAAHATLPPTTILPQQTQTLACFIPSSEPLSLSSGDRMLSLTVTDQTGTFLARATHTISSPEQVPSWEYTWWYKGNHLLRIPSVDWLYEYDTGLPRLDISDYAAYVFDTTDDAYINFTAHQLLLSETSGASDVETIQYIASFVQSIPYMKDDPNNDSYEYARYPVETLKERRGDCEDKAILGAALLSSLGYNVSLLRLPHHMAVGVHLPNASVAYNYYEKEYYYLEMTAENSPLGRVPSEYQDLTNVSVYPIVSRPLLVHSWKNATRYTTSTGLDYIKVRVLVENLGSASASSYDIRGFFRDDADLRYNQNSISCLTIPAQGKQIADLQVTVPEDGSTLLITQILLHDVKVDERESSSRFP